MSKVLQKGSGAEASMSSQQAAITGTRLILFDLNATTLNPDDHVGQTTTDFKIKFNLPKLIIIQQWKVAEGK